MMRQKKCCSNLAVCSSVIAIVLSAIASIFALPNTNNAQRCDGSSKTDCTKTQSSRGELHLSGSERSFGSATTTGCSIAHIEGYSSNESRLNLESGRILRYYTIDVLVEYNLDRTKSWPLIMDLHGASHTSRDQYDESRYLVADRGKSTFV